MDNADQFVKQVLKAILYLIFVYPFVFLKKKLRNKADADGSANDETAGNPE